MSHSSFSSNALLLYIDSSTSIDIVKDIKEAAKAQEDEKTTQVSAAVAKQFISALNEIKSLYAKRLSYEIKASKTAAAQYKAVLKKCAKAAGKDEKKEEK